MRKHSDKAWADILASDTRTLAGAIDDALDQEREDIAQMLDMAKSVRDRIHGRKQVKEV